MDFRKSTKSNNSKSILQAQLLMDWSILGTRRKMASVVHGLKCENKVQILKITGKTSQATI